MPRPPPLPYATPRPVGRRPSVTGWVALAIAVLAATVPMGVVVLRTHPRWAGGQVIHTDVSAGYFVVPAAAIAFAAVAIGRGSSRWMPVGAIMLAGLAAAAVGLIDCGLFDP